MEMTFEQWMNAVDRQLSIRCGLTNRDLADQTYRDWYNDEYTPEEAALETLENEGFPL